MLALKDGSHIRLISRQGVDHMPRFPDIAGAVAKLPSRNLILDGEVCVLRRSTDLAIPPDQWSAPHFSAHREELSVSCSARYSAGLRIPSAECGAWVL